MAYQGTMQLSAQDIYSAQPDNAGVWLGQKGQVQDGRTFVFCLNGSGAALVAGKHVAAPAATANHLSRTLTVAAAARATQVTVPLGATAATANQYQNGYLVVVSGTGLGQQFVIKSNPAANSSTSMVVTLDNKTPVQVALDTTSVVSLYPAEWNGVALSAAALTQEVVGVPVNAVPASNYFWAQVSGRASVLTDSAGAIAKGTEVTASAVVAGAVAASATTNVGQTLGFAPEATVTSQYQPILLQIV